ncbi:flagellar associated protein [Phlegmacium glaucopus]|nr:flagellar associated protein [Phlegmacium glaucopus]
MLTSESTTLSLLHFNDVYRVTPQKISSQPLETIDVTQFTSLLHDLRDQWTLRDDGNRDGLVLFSGDVFSPSIESTVTRGSHMVPVMNLIGVDVSLTGNHDFDFGYPHLSRLLQDTTFPWVLSNIIDSTTSRIPKHLKEFEVLERNGIRIGIIGLVEQEWITTVASWPPEFVYKPMKEIGLELSKRLRDPDGGYRCDFIVALTHCRLPNDILLAKELLALSPSGQKENPIASQHGVDLILGGHDHLYFVGRGVSSWDNFNVSEKVLGAKLDNGDVLVIKSGSDFRDLSAINIVLESTPKGSVRNTIVKSITGKRHIVLPGSKSSQPMSSLLKTLLLSVSSTLKAPVCTTTTMIDVRSYFIRVTESPVANFVADIIRYAYDDALCMKGSGGSDGVLLCAGTFRGDSTYGPGLVTMGDILEILPFEDAVVVLEIDGETLWDALESSLKLWPAQEGRFPAISGFRVTWDSRKEPGSRVLGVWLLTPNFFGNKQASLQVDEEPIERVTGGRKYKIVTREYLAQGHDGFSMFTKGKLLIDHDCGAIMSSIVRKYLLGSQFVNKLIRLKDQRDTSIVHQERTRVAVDLQKQELGEVLKPTTTTAARQWKRTLSLVRQARPALHYRHNIAISTSENMTAVDVFDGHNTRKGRSCNKASAEVNPDLLVVSPAIDGRLKDEGQESSGE